MNYHNIEIELKKLESFLNLEKKIIEIIHVVNINNIPCIGDKRDKSLNAIPYPPSSELSNKSGVYLFCKEDGEVLYIGKATKNNVRNRIFDHLQTPEASSEKNWVIYPKNKFNDNLIKEGKVKVGIFEVKPAKYSSLIEIYLQSIAENLPRLCKKIG